MSRVESMFDPRGPTFLELAKQALSSTTRGYDLLAPKFDYTPFRTPDEVLASIAEAIGPPGAIERALDVCCGTGAIMEAIRDRCTESVTGIDLSQGMLDEAADKLRDAPGDAKIRLEQGDVFEMDYEGAFDVVATSGSLGHILQHRQDRFVGRIRAALKPGGRFIFPTAPMPSKTSPRWWLSRAFNGLMHVRNALIEPPFIMFYLTFTVERAEEVLTRHDFDVDVRDPYADTDYSSLRLVVATRRT